jgi:uncharacterized protein (TIGR03437 family)
MIFGNLANLSAASFNGAALAPESLVTAYGTGLATQTTVAGLPPLPTTLGGTRVQVRDSQGAELVAQLFFVSPNQVNYLMPAGLAPGQATVTVMSETGQVSTGSSEIAPVAPGIFTADASGKGWASGFVLRVRGGGQQALEPLARFDAAQNAFIPAPIDLSVPDEQVYLVLFGTGFRHHRGCPPYRPRLVGSSSIRFMRARRQGCWVWINSICRCPLGWLGREWWMSWWRWMANRPMS